MNMNHAGRNVQPGNTSGPRRCATTDTGLTTKTEVPIMTATNHYTQTKEPPRTPDPRDISINDGSHSHPEHGVAQGVPARIGARVFDGDGGVGIVVALTDQLVIYREDKDGLEYAQRYGFCSSTLRPAAETPGMTGDQHDYHLTIRLGRKVLLWGDEDREGKLVGTSPAGCLVETEGGQVIGADWNHIDFKIDFGAGGIDAGAQAETSPGISVVNGSQHGGASGGVPVVVGDVVWHEDETGSQTREVLAVYPTHAELDNKDGDPIEAGWDKVLVYAHDAARNVARSLGKTPAVPTE